MGKISQVSFMGHLQNDAFVVLYDQLMHVLQTVEHKVSNEVFDTALERALQNHQFTNMIRAKDRVHELTKTIAELHTKRCDAFRSLKLSIKANLIHPDDKNKEGADYLEKWFRKHDNIAAKNQQDVMTRRIDDIAMDLEMDVKLLEVMEKMNATSLFVKLISINEELKVLQKQRSIERAEKKTRYVDTKKVRRDAMRDLKILFGIIEREVFWNEKDVANHLVKSLEDVLSRAKTIHELRKTQRKNQKNKTMDDANTEQNGVEPISGNSKEYENEDPQYG